MKFDPYKIIGCVIDSTPTYILSEYKKKARLLHPDKGGTKEAFHLLQLAKDVLTNPVTKRLYDNGCSDKNRIWAWADGEATVPEPRPIPNFTTFFNRSKSKVREPKGEYAKKRRAAKLERETKEATEKKIKHALQSKKKIVNAQFKKQEEDLKTRYEHDLKNLRILKKARLDEVR
jgi:DnaJ-class molecular chaperone